MPLTAAEIARLLNGGVVGDGAVEIRNFAPADRAQPGDLTFAENGEYFAKAEQSAASVVVVDGKSRVTAFLERPREGDIRGI